MCRFENGWLFLGLQGGYTKFPCFLRLWDSKARTEHWIKKDWPARSELIPGSLNVLAPPLVELSKIVFPPLHIKFGIMKQFVKAFEKDGNCFKYICIKFPGLTIEKLKAGIFDGPQIQKLINDANFCNFINSEEMSACTAFTNAVKFFLVKTKAPNYKKLVEILLKILHQLGPNMSIKLHFLHSHLACFPENLRDVSDQQGEHFHQDISDMEVRYQGRWYATMLADYCWSIKRDDTGASHSRKSVKRQFMANDVYA